MMNDIHKKFDYVKRYLGYLLSHEFNYPLSHPKELNFQVTNRCPLNCIMCNISKLSPSSNEMTYEEMRDVIDQVVDWGVEYISFVGGEALVRKNDTLRLIKYSNERGFHTTLISSGYFLDRKVCKELIDNGLNRLTISLDGATEKTHDYIRGKGAFEKAISSMGKLVELRGKVSNCDLALDFSTVIMSHNFRELVDIYRLAKNIGVDRIFYQAVVLDNTYESGPSGYNGCDFWINEDDMNEFENVVDKLIKIKENDSDFLFNSRTYLELLPDYFRLKNEFNPGRCLAGYMNLNIDPYGNISVCGLGPNLNVRDAPLRELWTHDEFKKTRIKIKDCKVPCMMLCYGKFEPKEMIKHLLD